MCVICGGEHILQHLTRQGNPIAGLLLMCCECVANVLLMCCNLKRQGNPIAGLPLRSSLSVNVHDCRVRHHICAHPEVAHERDKRPRLAKKKHNSHKSVL